MNKYEPILYLKGPKLINNIIINSISKNIEVELTNVINEASYNIKEENKRKSNDKNKDFIENKKNKQKKQGRSKIYLDKHISEIKEGLEKNEVKSLSFISNTRKLKNKKQNKDKLSLDSNISMDTDKYFNEIYLNDLVTVRELSIKLNVSATDIIKWLFLQGISVTINQLLDLSISTLVAEHYSFNVLRNSFAKNKTKKNQVNDQSGQLRAPIITLLGHVDHGKTTLLNCIKKDNLFNKESGDITQNLCAHEVFVDNEKKNNKLIFLDTPGHEAFISMRERGANITDILLLVVAADDGLKPQTVEAITHIQNRDLPFIVAINKIDKPNANLDKIKKQLLEFNISDKDIKGNNIIIGVSALNNINIELLLSALINLSNNLNLRSNTSVNAEGTILEASLNKKRGPIAQLLVQNGTLKLGDIVVTGNIFGKVKAITSNFNKKVDFIESTSLVDILCFTKVPMPGLPFQVVQNEKVAKTLTLNYQNSKNQVSLLNNRISLDDFSNNKAKSIVKQVNLIIKTENQGSIDAILHILTKLPQDKVQINLLLVSCGEVSLKDLKLAYASNSMILVFNLNISPKILQYSNRQAIIVKSFKVVYDLIDYIKQHMLKFVDLDYEKNIIGYAEVKNLFTVNKKVIAGCFVKEGKMKKNSLFQLKRLNTNIHIGSIDSLKIVKDDVQEVYFNNDCGIMCNSYSTWELKDLLECYELIPLEKKL